MRKLIILYSVIYGAFAVDSLRFLAIGDWGGSSSFPYDTSIEKAVAKQMAAVADTYGTSFTLALGDNFYDDGVKNVDDKRFKYTFEEVYHYDSLMKPWYLVAGNHDHHGNVSAQIAYSKKSSRWNFPNNYYALSFPIPGGKSVDILMLDTVVLCGDSDKDELGLQPNGPDSNDAAEDEWAWIEKQIEFSKGDYLLVTGHYPVYSIAEHGSTKCLTSRLKPMLYKYGVTAYLCGHDHNLQHISSSENGNTVDFFVTGAADKIDTSTEHKHTIPDGALKFHWADSSELGGFAYIDATASNMTLMFVDGKKKNLYSYTLFPRKTTKY